MIQALITFANWRCRPDIIYETPDGHLRGREVKTGKAKLSKNQDKIYDQMKDGDAIPVGPNAEKFGLEQFWVNLTQEFSCFDWAFMIHSWQRRI